MTNPLKNALSPSCDFCVIDNIGEFEKLYIERKMPVLEILEKLDKKGNRQGWYNHIKYHVAGETSLLLSEASPMVANMVIDKLEECVQFLDKLKDKIEKLDSLVENGAEPATIRAWTGLLTESRGWLEFLAKLQGQFNEGSKIKANTVNIQVNNLIGDMMELLCNNCKLKIAEKASQKPEYSNILKLNANNPSS